MSTTIIKNTYAGIVPKLSAKIRMPSEGGVSLATAYKIIGCGTNMTLENDLFYFTSDGGIRVLKAGLVYAVGYINVASVTSGDVVQAAIGSYANGGWKHESDSMLSAESSTRRTLNVFTLINAAAGDTIYLRAGNSTAARGSVSSAKLVVFQIS